MFKQRLKELRNRKQISQSDLAKVLSVSQQTIGSWEVGRSEPNTEMLSKIADYFMVTTDYLLGRKIDDDLTVAAHQDPDVTPEMQKEIDEYIEFKKAQYRKAHQNKED